MLPHTYSIEKMLKNKISRRAASQSLFSKSKFACLCGREMVEGSLKEKVNLMLTDKGLTLIL